MTVREMIRLLEKIPGDYNVGQYFAPNLSRIRFKLSEPIVGVNNDKRWVSLGFGHSLEASISDMQNTFDLTSEDSGGSYDQ